MFCQKCGTELPEKSEFCHKCGSKVAEGAAFSHNCVSKEVYEDAQYPLPANTDGAKKGAALRKVANIGRVLIGVSMVALFLSSFWKLPISPIILVAVAAVGIILSAIGVKRPLGLNKIIELIVAVVLLVAVAVYAISSGRTGDKYIQMVKNGTLEAYPQMTVGEAFDGYLDNPKWETGLSEDKQRFVNVKGGILYYEKEAEIAVQFIVDEKDSSFQYYACEINGLPQNNLVVLELFETIYGTESTEEGNQVDSENPEETIESSSAANAPVYDVDDLGDNYDTSIISERSVEEIEDYITSYVRPLYNEINSNLSKYSMSSSNGVTYWHDGKGYIKKVFSPEVNNYGFTREYYFDTDSGRIAFAFVYSGSTEYRLYFRANQLVRFIPPNGQAINNPDSVDALEMGTYVISEAYQ